MHHARPHNVQEYASTCPEAGLERKVDQLADTMQRVLRQLQGVHEFGEQNLIALLKALPEAPIIIEHSAKTAVAMLQRTDTLHNTPSELPAPVASAS